MVITKFVGNATRNEAVNQTLTTAAPGDNLNWLISIKNNGTGVLQGLLLEDQLPANLGLTSDIIISGNGQPAKFGNFINNFLPVGDLLPGQSVTVQFSTALSRDVACNDQLVNSGLTVASNVAGQFQALAGVKVQCQAVVAGSQTNLVNTGSSGLLVSFVLSLLSISGYFYAAARRRLATLTGRL